MSFTDWLQYHRRSILFLIGVLSLAGIMTSFNLPVSLFPNVQFPRVAVTLDSGDRTADQMMLQVTMPVEEAIRRVPGVRDERSTTSRGSAEVSVTFDWGSDMNSAAMQINAAISQILPTLPQGTQLNVVRMDPTSFPCLAYSLTSDNLSLTQLHDIAQYQIRPLLSSVDGVARVQILGGEVEEYQVLVDPARLQSYGLSMSDVTTALNDSNVISAVGRLEDHYKLYLVVVNSAMHDLSQIGNTVLRIGGKQLVRLSDIATVQHSTAPQWLKVTADGHEAVLFQIYQQPGANTVRLSKGVEGKLAVFKASLPAGLKVANWYDQSELVVSSAASVRDAILIGILLAAAVLYAFLRNSKVTIITVMIVPAVLATTVLLLKLLGMSFNIMTLGGMAAAIGLIVDDAIVMIEHIMRRLIEGDRPHHERVMRAAVEFLRPLASSSAATLLIFVPLAFLTGVTGAFFKALSLTMASGLFISFLITWFAVPLLADRWLTEKDAEKEQHGALTAWFQHRYQTAMQKMLARPVWLLAGIVPLAAAGFLAWQATGSGFMPAMDEGGFILDYRTPPGTSLTETDRLLQQVGKIIKSNPNVATYSRRTGAQLGGGITEAYEGDFFIRLKSGQRQPIETVMDDIRTKVEAEVPGLDIELAQLMEDMIGDLTAVPQPIEVKIFSDDEAQLAGLAKKTAAAISKVDGVVDVRDGINPAGDSMEIRIDQARATAEGMAPATITAQLNDILAGNVSTQFQQGPKMVGVRLWTGFSLRNTDSKLADLMLRAPDGHLFPLKRVADIVPVIGQPQIVRENLKRMDAVTGRISGRDMGSVIRDVKQVMDQPGMLPQGVYYELGGLYQQQQIAFRGLMAVLAAAVVLVFLLLLYVYESFRVALSIMAMPLMALGAVFIGLWSTGIELNISAMMGMTMIVGIVTEVAIFYTSEYQSLIGTMPRHEALLQAGINRMRPIAMTSIAAILTLLPLAFALGQGAAMQQPLAVAIISGLVVQLPLVLLVMPVLFDLAERLGNKSSAE